MNILLLTGGHSAEREVSLSSGRAILKALRENGHFVKVVDPIYGDEDVTEEIIFKDNIKRDYPTKEKIRELQKKSSRRLLDCINSSLLDNIDLVFIGLHGKYGEDGKVQTLLDIRGKKYTGSGVLSSILAMDKSVSKAILRYKGIPTPDWITLFKENNISTEKIFRDLHSGFGFPCVVKPNDEGSTVGMTILYKSDEQAFKKAIELAYDFSDKIIIEKYIKGREITVPVIGDESFPVIEIIPIDGYYDYEHKYSNGMTEYICPAEIDKRVEIQAKEIALQTHKYLECSVYSRVDFILDESGQLHCLELNTLPGMTGTSLVPKSALKNNMDFNMLIEKIISLSLNK